MFICPLLERMVSLCAKLTLKSVPMFFFIFLINMFFSKYKIFMGGCAILNFVLLLKDTSRSSPSFFFIQCFCNSWLNPVKQQRVAASICKGLRMRIFCPVCMFFLWDASSRHSFSIQMSYRTLLKEFLCMGPARAWLFAQSGYFKRDTRSNFYQMHINNGVRCCRDVFRRYATMLPEICSKL